MKTKYYVANISGGKDSMAMFFKLIWLGYPLNEAIFFDGGWDFNCIYKNIELVKSLCKIHNIKFTIIHSEKSFDYLMFDYQHKTRKGEDVIGYSWCGGNCRWGTTQKTQAINNHFKQPEYADKEIYHYIGLAYDEQKRIAKNKDPYKLYPLNEMQITEQMALDICVKEGVDFRENNVCLYDMLDRVSCWCCRNKNLDELRNYYSYLPEYWQKLKDYQSRTNMPFKSGYTVLQLEKRFELEKEFIAAGQSIRSKLFFKILKERITQQAVW